MPPFNRLKPGQSHKRIDAAKGFNQRELPSRRTFDRFMLLVMCASGRSVGRSARNSFTPWALWPPTLAGHRRCSSGKPGKPGSSPQARRRSGWWTRPLIDSNRSRRISLSRATRRKEARQTCANARFHNFTLSFEVWSLHDFDTLSF